jgi:choline kinase
MVYSLFKVRSIKSNNIVVCYGDIIFDESIFNDLKKRYSSSIILLKKNWLKIWRGRMKYSKIKNDAENVEIKDNYLISIGKKITDKLPKYQYMGIIKFKKEDFYKLKKFFKKIKNTKIDFTSFLDMAIKFKIIRVKAVLTSKFWYEIDNLADINFTEKNLW